MEDRSTSQFHSHAQLLKLKHSSGRRDNQTWQTECSTSQFHSHAQLRLKHSGGPLDNQTWQTEWKTAPQASFTVMRSCWDWNILAGRWTIKLGRQSGSLLCSYVQQGHYLILATAHDCGSGVLLLIAVPIADEFSGAFLCLRWAEVTETETETETRDRDRQTDRQRQRQRDL